MNPNAKAIVDVAVSLIPLRIPYVLGGESRQKCDCQGLIKLCIREAGGTINFAGSNDMFRHGAVWRGTIAEAKAQGKLVPGAAVFVVKHDSGEPGHYKADGIGNAKHVGLYCGRQEVEVMSASSVKGYVGATTLDKGWTHAAWLKDIDYTPAQSLTSPNQPTPVIPPNLSCMDIPKAIAAAQEFLDAVGALRGGNHHG